MLHLHTSVVRRALAIAGLALPLAGAASPGVYLEEMTSPELRDRIAAGATTALVPIGGTEQSGPHIVLGKHNVRARVLAGPPDARKRLEAILSEVLHTPRDSAKLKEDVLAMRAEMATHKPARGVLDVKLQRGGLIDLEFLIHYLQLRERISITPEMVSALHGLIGAGLLPESLKQAQVLLIRVLVASRLLAPDTDEPPEAARDALARACGATDYPALLVMLAEARQVVAAAWQQVFGTAILETAA